jgi:glycosyltransferase involved in cell wall biosynthesis
MALGCPVISSDQSSMPQVCGEAALLAPPTDASKWLSHIRAVASSKDLQSDLRGRGFEQVKKFSWTASARGYLDLFGITA